MPAEHYYSPLEIDFIRAARKKLGYPRVQIGLREALLEHFRDAVKEDNMEAAAMYASSLAMLEERMLPSIKGLGL